jgi:hypothetical protein
MADQNLIDSEALARVQDIEFVNQFEQGVSALLTVLDIAEPQVLTAGTQVQMYEVTGNLASGRVAEGDDIPLSMYAQTKGVAYSVDLEEYRKATSAQAILKFGFDAAVTKTDRKMLRDIQGTIRKKFFDFLALGTGTATGATFQQAFAMAWGTLVNTLSEMDTDGTPIYFANPLDLATYLGAATINNVETAFGFTYIRNFLSLGTCVFDAKVPKGTVYATLEENINCYAVDLTELAKGGLAFETSDETGLIGVHHTGRYQNGTAETYADTGLLLFPEVANYIVKATIGAAPSDGEDGGEGGGDGGEGQGEGDGGQGDEPTTPTLSALTVGNLTLVPEFDPDVTEYAVTTSNATNTVSATATDETHSIDFSMGGQRTQPQTGAASNAFTWETGENVVTVNVVGEHDLTGVYTITVTKE